ncbi:MAG: hypothetical protein JW909_01105 [Planctomycetes bacterium]|nr:hypothetical protein [Planctomycetota bacterium]
MAEQEKGREASRTPGWLKWGVLGAYAAWVFLNLLRDAVTLARYSAEGDTSFARLAGQIFFDIGVCLAPLGLMWVIRKFIGRAEALGTMLVILWCGASGFFIHFSGTSQQQFVLIMGFGAMFILFLLAMVNRYLRKGFAGKQDLAIIYTMLLVAVPLAILYRGILESGIRNLDEGYLGKKTYTWVMARPWLSATKESAVQAFYDGPLRPVTFLQSMFRTVPWSEWVYPLFYWSVVFAFFLGACLAFVALWRRRWIDEEKLPFPWTRVPMQLIESSEPEEDIPDRDADATLSDEEIGRRIELRLLARKAMRWGLAIGLLVTIPGLLPHIWEKIPSPVGVPPSPQSWGVDLTAFQLFEGVMLFLSIEPFVLISAMFLPLDFLLTVFLTYVGLNMILPWFLTKLGIPKAGSWMYHAIYMVLRSGGIVGIPLWTLWFGRDHLAAVFRSILKPVDPAAGDRRLRWGYVALSGGWVAATLLALCTATPGLWLLPAIAMLILGILSVAGIVWGARNLPDESAKTEALSYRTLLIMFLAAVCCFVFIIRLGTSFQVALLSLVIIAFINFAYARIRAGGAYPIYAPWHTMKSMGHWQKNLLVGYQAAEDGSMVKNPLGQWQTEQGWMGAANVGTFGVAARSLGPHTFFAEPFRIGADVGIHPRRVFRAIALSLALVLFIAGPVYLTYAYQYGNRNISSDWQNYSRWTYYADTFGTRETPGTFTNDAYWFWILLGVAIYGVLFYLRREKAGWPLSPVGVFFAAVPLGYCELNARHVWFALLVALGLKYTLFRWYGVMNFRRRIQPVLAWALVGMVGGMLLLMVVLSFRGEGVWHSTVDVLIEWFDWLRTLGGGS